VVSCETEGPVLLQITDFNSQKVHHDILQSETAAISIFSGTPRQPPFWTIVLSFSIVARDDTNHVPNLSDGSIEIG
jgi:hypothetical protein